MACSGFCHHHICSDSHKETGQMINENDWDVEQRGKAIRMNT